VRVDFNSSDGHLLGQGYQVRGRPTILLIDKTGTGRATIIGVPTRERVEQEIARIVL
jgi:thioredoxin-related protein